MLHLNLYYNICLLMKILNKVFWILTQKLVFFILFEKYLYFSRNMLFFNKHIVH